jgi:RHS repeat-associated protein
VTLRLLVALLLFGMSESLIAAGAVQWPIGQGGNGHWYQLVTQPFLLWPDARAQAAAMGGYLATVTSAAENDWIKQNILPSAPVGTAVWIGGADFNLSGQWKWVEGPETGQLFWQRGVGTVTYANWGTVNDPGSTNEPNNCCAGPEYWLAMNIISGKWLDLFAVPEPFLVEFNSDPTSLHFGPSSTISQHGSIAEPVNTATGNYSTLHTDLAVPGKGLSFALARAYNSLDPYSGPLGVGWTHSLNIVLQEDAVTGVVTIKEGDGHQVSFTPTGGGNYSAVTKGLFDNLKKNADGTFTLTRKNQTQFNFSATGKLLTIVDRNGNTQTLSYTGGNPTSIQDSSGRLFTLNYDSTGRIISVIDALGRTLQYSYDAASNLISFRDGLGGLTQYNYDANHRMISATDPRGNVYLQNTYDAQGRVIVQKNARGFSTTFAYDSPSSGITTIVDPLGNITKHTHNSLVQLTSVVDGLAGTTSYLYDSNNLKTSATDPLGRTQALTYDGNGNLTAVTDPNGKTTSFLYDAKNNLTRITDRLGRITNFVYDSKGNLLSTTDAATGVSSFSYDPSGQVLAATNARSFTTQFTYDASGNVIRVSDALSGTVQLTYDAVGRLLSVKNQLGNTGTRTYDANNRLLSVADPLGNTTQFAYDANGNVLQITDANARLTQYAYDSTNKLTQVTDAIGGITRYEYNGNTDLTKTTDAASHATTYAYDALRHLTVVTDPLGRQKRYNYSSVGNVTSTVDGSNKTNTFGYDSLNRLTSMALSDGKNVGYSYDALGNRLTMADWRGTTSYGYDVLNRVTSIATPDGKTVGYAYDAVGNRTTLSYPDGTLVQYTYDGLNRLTRVTDGTGKATNYAYDAAGNLAGLAHPNGASSSYQYDTSNRLQNITNRSGANTLSSFTYLLDRVGNRTQMTTSAGGVNRYGYDGLYRLTSWTAPSNQVTQWVYDAVGNRTSMVSSAGTTNYTYDAADELLTAGTATYGYDGNGNQIVKTASGSTVNYGWDALNRLASVVGVGINTQYQYDGDGNRVSQQVVAGTYAYVNDTATSLPVVINEAGPDGNITYGYGLSMISATAAAFQYYHQFDGLGSTSNLTDPAGAQKANYTYEPWGKSTLPLDPVGSKDKYKFTGEALDPNSGLVFLRARYYDPAIGRFISRDALETLGINQYQYGLANPTRFADQSGFEPNEPSPEPNPEAVSSENLSKLNDLASFLTGIAGDVVKVPPRLVGASRLLGRIGCLSAAIPSAQDLNSVDSQSLVFRGIVKCAISLTPVVGEAYAGLPLIADATRSERLTRISQRTESVVNTISDTIVKTPENFTNHVVWGFWGNTKYLYNYFFR